MAGYFCGDWREHHSEGKGSDVLAARLLDRVKEQLSFLGVPESHDVYVLINLDMQVSALGIIDYFNKLEQ